MLNNLWKLVPIGIIAFFSLVLIKAITISKENLLALLFSIIILIAFYILSKKVKLSEKVNNISEKSIKKIFLAIILIHIVIMIIFSIVLISEPKNDLGTIYHSALEIVNNGEINSEIDENTSCYHFYEDSNNDYFNRYPNNIMILMILTLLFGAMKLIGINLTLGATLIAAQIVNIICIEAAIILGVKILKKRYSNYSSFIFLILSCLFLPYYLNAFRFYTDTIVMPFIMLMLYFVVKLEDNLTNKQSILYWILLAIISFIGIEIKQSAAIVLIAIFVFYLLKWDKYKLIKFLTILLPIYLLFTILFGFYIHNCKWIDLKNEENIRLPAMHWISMGMSGDGGYNQKIVGLQLENETNIEQKEKIAIEIIKRELSGYNLLEFIDFELKKAVNTWCDGKYYQESHMQWYYNKTIIQEFILPEGKYYNGFDIITKIYSFLIIVTFIEIAVIQIKRKQCPNELLILLVIIGLAVFLSIWETKSRYVLSFIPMFLTLIAANISRRGNLN